MSKAPPDGSADDVLAQLSPLRRYARTLTRNETEAEDLVHDALVRAFERRGTFRLSGNLRTWLLSILHNVFIDARRKNATDQRREAEAAQLVDSSAPADQENAVRLQQVRRAFLDLPQEQRAVLHLVAIEGLAYHEAADTLGIPLGTLMSRLGRARAALRDFEEGRGAGPAALPSPRSGRPGSRLRVVGGTDD